MQSCGSVGEDFGYDKHGNINYFQRQSGNTTVDYFSYPAFNGNQIKGIFDYAGTQNSYSIKEYQDKNHVNGATNEMDYDANGNLKKDLDRDIVTIQYNLLNLPEIIQFKNGNQIKNLYDAGGQKLRSDYFTQLVVLSAPLTEGQTLQQNYIADVVDQNGTLYVGNKEYKFTGNQSGVYTLNQVHNPEGYVYFQGSPMYNYFRRDHLGNIREVWQANMNLTVQRTNYYPSGLPWNSATGTGAGVQNKKYNGKEFVEMHGLDTYDYGTRGYYAAMGRFTTVDPLCEKYYSISPYAYCLGNPVNAIDPDGREVYKLGFSYSMSSGVFGASVKIFGVGVGGSVSPGAVKQELRFYVSYDSDNKKVGVGVTHTSTEIESGNSVNVGPYSHSVSNQKESIIDGNTTTGGTSTSEKSSTKVESGGMTPIETTDKNGVTTTGISISGEINAGLLGVGAKVGMTVEPSPKTTISTSTATTPTPTTPPPTPLKPKEPWVMF